MGSKFLRAPDRFNDHGPKITDHAGSPRDERGRNKSVSQAWKSVSKELEAHRGEGLMVEPIRRAKISGMLVRDHHRSERTSGKTRGIIKGKV